MPKPITKVKTHGPSSATAGEDENKQLLLQRENHASQEDQAQDTLVLVGSTLKPFGLFGELKVKPESFDLDRHKLLKKVFFKKTDSAKAVLLTVESSRYQTPNWMLKFTDHKTPESVKPYSGGLLFVEEADKVELPQDMIYTSDVIGWEVVKEDGTLLGKIREINENAGQDLITVERSGKEDFLIPWVNVFVKKIDEDHKTMQVDVANLEGLYEN